MSQKKEISNFIGLCGNVYLLSDEERKVSHDIPFKDSYSGTIDITLTTLTPLFIRNHFVPGDNFYNKDNEKLSTEFCHYKGKPYIPSTSIKGTIKSVLEIFSYGKLVGKIDEKYNKRIIDNIYKEHHSKNLDLSEVIFGTTELKGRVFFSHFKADDNYLKPEKEIETILMTPEAKKDKIGWKRYVKQNNANPETKKKNENIITKFIPISNATFRGKMRYHNLRDFELGALLSALSFHNTEESFHLMGMGKSQGYGKVKISFKCDKSEYLMKSFESKMQNSLKYRDAYSHCL
jgi:CRISPR/Cas system CSM-associated protein Csm3 (group 7 of RAMP superfamily)